ncbi:MAG: hypothetical protein MI802_14275, partial [Desulfobacterales bacterium]|nr:hypothetical protein [Desulfobacterales bacterium]
GFQSSCIYLRSSNSGTAYGDRRALVRSGIVSVLHRAVCGPSSGETTLSWGVGRLTVAIYPFGAGAMAVNCFFLSLIGNRLGLPVLSTPQSIAIGSVVAIPLTWLFARHLHRLMIGCDDVNEPG